MRTRWERGAGLRNGGPQCCMPAAGQECKVQGGCDGRRVASSCWVTRPGSSSGWPRTLRFGRQVLGLPRQPAAPACVTAAGLTRCVPALLTCCCYRPPTHPHPPTHAQTRIHTLTHPFRPTRRCTTTRQSAALSRSWRSSSRWVPGLAVEVCMWGWVHGWERWRNPTRLASRPADSQPLHLSRRGAPATTPPDAESGPHHAQPPGQRRGHAVPQRHLLPQRGAEGSRREGGRASPAEPRRLVAHLGSALLLRQMASLAGLFARGAVPHVRYIVALVWQVLEAS